MTEFYTRVNGVEGTYQITFTTYDEKQYKEVENLCREFIDHKKPEPVYPTWKEWLEEQRVVVHFDSVSEKGTKVKWELTNKSNCHIPADIAVKLGLQPKEG